MIGITAIVAKLVDRRISRRNLTPAAATRYRILRRSIFITIVFVGLLSALLVIPQVRVGRRGDPRLVGRARPRARLRRPADDRQLHRRPADRVHAAGSARRRGRDRGRPRHRRGDRPHLHLGTHRRQRPARDPEREARLRDAPQLHDPQPAHAGRGHRARAADRRPPRARSPRSSATRPRRTSPTSPPTRRSPCGRGCPTSGSPIAPRATCG